MITKCSFFYIFLILLSTSANSVDLKSNIEAKVTSEKTKISNNISNKIVEKISAKISENENIKYFDLSVQLREHLKPSVAIESVTKLFEKGDSVVFNQTNLTTHDGSATVNVGVGARKLFYDEKLMIGSNIFLDQQYFGEGHLRSGFGLEAITSVFDLRGNYYNAISGFKNTDEGTEKALDGRDLQFDFHLEDKFNTNIFANFFKWEDPNSTYEDKGTKVGANAKFGYLFLEGGYLDDNRNSDSYFGSIKFVVPLGNKTKRNYYAMSDIEKPITDAKLKNSYTFVSAKDKRKMFEYVSVRDKLFIPVKRENKIKLVKISKSGVKVSGF
tara:strand:- start:202 stop:1185 length:984 start_codon:yes stop_codon:yes gene_type:complete